MTGLQHIYNVFQNNLIWKEAQWLIVGKGPTFSLYSDHLLKNFHLATLNDAVREVKSVAIAHFIDFEAYLRCEQYLGRAEKVVLPWYPHFNNKPSRKNLEELIKLYPSLRDLYQKGRLCWYDLISSPEYKSRDIPVPATYFSCEALLFILAQSGVRTIRSIGVDGGDQYDHKFSDLNNISLLTNRQKNFDKQFQSFPNIIQKFDIDFGPLDMELPVKVFVAATASEYLPFKVLEYSIKSKASATTQVISLDEFSVNIPMPAHNKNRARTPFSFQRFLIPKSCEYKGRAIYLDSDMLIFKDITNLWNRDFGDYNVLSAYSYEKDGRVPQYSVMLLNCSDLNWDIEKIVDMLDAGEISYEKLMYDFVLANPIPEIEEHWNSLERYDEFKTSLLHYTDMKSQPWVSTVNPLAYLWVKSLQDAIKSGFVSLSLVQEEVEKGHIRPSLIYQLESNIDDPRLLPKNILKLDESFKAPFTQIESVPYSYLRRILFRIKNIFRKNLYFNALSRIFRN